MAGILLHRENVTDDQQAAHARKVSEINRAEALERNPLSGAAADIEDAVTGRGPREQAI